MVTAAALLRVLGPLLAPWQTVNAVLASAALWSAGFALYTWRYWPLLTRAHVDARPA